MKSKETLIIKNFGPIVDAKIEIKPFMVFIGESGSGKSVILKTLALCRWIYKKINFASVVAHIEPTNKSRNMKNVYKNVYKQEIGDININSLINISGLSDFLNADEDLEIKYSIDKMFSFTVKMIDKKIRLEVPDNFYVQKDDILLEKISFISDDRFSIPTLLQGVVGFIPYHTMETFSNFNEATFFFTNNSTKMQSNILDFELMIEKKKDKNEWFITKNGHRVHFDNASSGMKSVAIIEPIIKFYTQEYDIQKSLNEFLLSIVNKRNLLPVDILLDIALNMQKGNITEKYKRRISLFMEEPEISLFPNAQKALVEHLVDTCFNNKKRGVDKEINIAFATHSPYILSALNCLLLAHQVGSANADMKAKVESIVSSKFWLDIDKFNAFVVENGKVNSIIDKETNLILADKIDGVSEEISAIYDDLLDLQ